MRALTASETTSVAVAVEDAVRIGKYATAVVLLLDLMPAEQAIAVVWMYKENA